MSTEQEHYTRIKQHVNQLRELYIHGTVYGLVIIFAFALNLFVITGFPWSFFLAGAWGIGLIIHGLCVYENSPFSDAWVERKTHELMQQQGMKRKNKIDLFE